MQVSKIFTTLSQYRKAGAAAAALAATTVLGGCATMNNMPTDTCITQRGSSLNLLFISFSDRKDSFNEECAATRAATVIAGMKRPDGTPDLGAYSLAVSMYEVSNPSFQRLMDKMLREQGTNIDTLRFEVARAKEPIVCEKQPTADAARTTFICRPREMKAATGVMGLTGGKP